MDSAMEVWQFEKTIKDRLKEYHVVFDNFDQNSSVLGYSSVWATYLSNILQQYSWLGVWCPSHKECLEFNLHAPINTNVSVCMFCFFLFSTDRKFSANENISNII